MRLQAKYFHKQDSYSEEGFKEVVDKFKSLFITSKKPKPPKRKGKDKQSLETYSEQIKSFHSERKNILNEYKNAIIKTYLNDSELNKFKFTDGDIQARDITSIFILDEEYQEDFEKAISINLRNLKEVENYKKSFNEIISTANVLDRELVKLTSKFENPDNIDSNKAEVNAKEIGKIIKPFLSKMPNYQNTLDPKIEKLPKTFLPNFIKNKKDDYFVKFINHSVSTPEKLPALTKESIKKIASLSIMVIDYLLSLSEWQYGGSYEDDGEIVRKYFDYPESLMNEWYELTYYQNFWVYSLDDLEDGMIDVLQALEKYMDRSVK